MGKEQVSLEGPEEGPKSLEDTSKEPYYLTAFKEVVANKKKAAIFTHICPDPDAVGSMMAMQWLLDKHFGVETDLFYGGEISHPQNKTMMNLLDPGMQNVSFFQEENYDLKILVDTVPSYAATGGKDINFDVVIDHHPESNGFKSLYINLKAGSAAATVYHLINKLGYKFDRMVDEDTRVATAVIVGVYTDTENMLSEDSTNYEQDAFGGTLEARDVESLKSIVHYERPKLWVRLEAEATTKLINGEATIDDGVAVVGIGLIPEKHRDVIADIAQKLISWEDVHTSIVFAIVGNESMQGSIRSHNSTTIVPEVCKCLGGKHGNGGGKRGKGAYSYNLAGGGIDEEDDEDTKEATWQLYQRKETARIKRILAK